MDSAYRVGCDIGGTFTDFVLIDTATGRIHTAKRLTTPADPSIGMLAGLRDLAEAAPGYTSSTERLAHATTLVANAVIERKGVKTALLCTAGFRDVIELRRYVRVTTYEMFADPPVPLVPRNLRIPVNERTRADGSIRQPLDPEEIAQIAKQLKTEGVRSVAVAFLHSFTNPTNERAAGAALAKFLPGVAISLSSDVLPQIREYERTSTTVVNAYVKPLALDYLGKLEHGVVEAGFHALLQIMLSNGGVGSARTAAEFPVRLVESGPVAGAVMAHRFARLLGLPEVLAYDMGGTTAKACLIRDLVLPLTDELEVARSRRFTKSSGYPVAIPAVNMIEVGAGGGSIARINALGIVQVGPESAAADPGPACYGLGGLKPTVSDADLVLGYLDPERFAGGTMRLDEADHGFHRRSSSAWAKYAEALRRISLACLSSRFSRSSALMRSRSSVVVPGRLPWSRSAWRTQFDSVCAVQPILTAIEAIAAHCDVCSLRCSNTIRTARSRTSGENFGDFDSLVMAPLSQELEPPANPGRFKRDGATAIDIGVD